MRYHVWLVSLAYVIDTDVMVAALRSERGASRQILMSALDREFEMLVSVPLMLEYEAVLTRQEHLLASGLTNLQVRKILDDLAGAARPVRLAFRWRPRLPDADDDMVLETAMNGGANAIVTFNVGDFAAASAICRAIPPLTALRKIRSHKS